MHSPSRRKRAQLVSSTGAGVLGFALGAMLAQWSAPYALPLLAVGVLMHAWGMLETKREEAGTVVPLWSGLLYWLCWIGLAMLIGWMVLPAFG